MRKIRTELCAATEKPSLGSLNLLISGHVWLVLVYLRALNSDFLFVFGGMS